MELKALQRSVTEITFTTVEQYADPYNDIDLDCVVDGPGGTVRVPAFWSGGNAWRIRLCGETPGRYTCRTVCSNPGDQGLHNQTFSLDVVPGNPGGAFARGRLRVGESEERGRRHFVDSDGKPFFWVGDTWWMGLSTRLGWPDGFRELAADRVGKGFNVIQIIAGPYPDMDAWDRRGRNEAGFPFEDGFERVNPRYYDHADLRIAHLVRAGLMPCIVGMWGYYLPVIGVERIKRFWRYLVARYGAYPVTWCICGEGAMPYYLSDNKEAEAAQQKAGWTEVMAHVREIDPYQNLITIHPTQFGRDQVESPSLMDLEMLQTGHGDMESVPNTAASVMQAVEREPVMPVINSEVNYEGILGRAWQNVQRLCFYHSVLNGTAGHTYGANGIWQMSTREDPYGPSPHGRCWGNTPWREAMALPGSAQVGIGGRFIARFPWWRLESHPEWVGVEAQDTGAYTCRCVGIPGELRIIYVPMLWDAPVVRELEPGVEYNAFYCDPCTGEEIPAGAVEAVDGKWQAPFPPEVHDWLLVLEKAKP